MALLLHGETQKKQTEKNAGKGRGVECNHRRGHVVRLDLGYLDLQGTLVPPLAELHHLKYLDLSFNSFNLTEFLKFITSLTHLKYLDLSFMNLKGKIPYELRDLFRLQILDLSGNNLSDELDDFVESFSWIGDGLKMLRILILRSNMFPGSLPSNTCYLSQAQILDLSMNNISGSLPKCMNNLSALANKTNSDANISYSASDNEFRDLNGPITFGLLDNLLEDSALLVV
ncbi:receptor-like protein EIX2 [Prosopis cineraria]|uniref:receptor-like protein EIX2 n=1 Tax=Prosopis cineraria TaxID=364024 RepID=UPI002410566F|nr:receptor-like protein EIX2 [Prosopis cineraria]